MKTLAYIAIGLTLMVLLAFYWEARVADETNREIAAKLDKARGAPHIKSYNFEGLPKPVAGYLEKVLPDPIKLLTGAKIEQSGSMRLNLQKEDWKLFTARQIVNLNPPAFDWGAEVIVGPWIYAQVHDSLLAGQGGLTVTIYTLPVVDAKPSDELQKGQMLRYLSEGTWYPISLLPSEYLKWEAIDDNNAKATLTLNGISADLIFQFGKDGLVAGAYTKARARQLDSGGYKNTPWGGFFRDYKELGGFIIPTTAEAYWELDGKKEIYWRGQIKSVEYQH